MITSMSDSDIITEAVAEHTAGHPITDGQARVIASAWHGGQVSALCALATSGAVLEGVEGEIEREIDAVPADEGTELEALLAYVQRTGERAPVAGWHQLWG